MGSGARFIALVALLPLAACGGAEADSAGALDQAGSGADAGAADAKVPLVTGPLSYDVDGVHQEGTLAFAQRMDAASFRLAGSASDQVVTIYLMRAVPLISAGTYSCDSTAFVTFSIRSAFYTSLEGSCIVNFSALGGVGDPIVGAFAAVVRNEAGVTKILTGGKLSGTITAE
jgi:hypothetical protein